MTLQASWEQKRHWLERRLAPWADRLNEVASLPGESGWGYRDRVALSAQWHEGSWRFGVWHRDELIPIPECPIHSDRVREAIALFTAHLPSAERFRLAFYVQSAGQIVLVLKQSQPPPTDWFNDGLAEALAAAGVEGLAIHCFPSAGRRLFTKRGWYRLWGEGRSRDGEGFWYGPGAFTQPLPRLHARSLDEAERFLSPGEGARVVDLYCGRGVSLRRWLDTGAEALGVESGGEALACAALNAPAATLLRGNCAQRLPQVEPWLYAVGKPCRLVYLNPPRTGLEPGVAEWLSHTSGAERIAYLSCSAGTLARDLEQICRGGYRVERISPYDFFPRTYHVETLVLLSRETGRIR